MSASNFLHGHRRDSCTHVCESSIEAMENLVSAYHSFNGAEVDELTEEPTPLEFMRYVAKNRPFIVRRAVSHWPACRWNIAYLIQTLGNDPITVAVTPYG